MKITIDIPKGVTKEEIMEVIKKYIRKKEKYMEYYKLVEGVDWNELEKEADTFRKSFRLRKLDG